MFVALATPALAQRDLALQPAAAVFLDTDFVAGKMLGAARDFIAARQWEDAIELLRQIADQHGERLVAIEPGRYVNVQTITDILIASLPPEGLKLYRTKIDPQARRWFETARRLRDEEGLEKVVRRAFLSSYGDDALLLLGELAWEAGALPRARTCWEKLLPSASPPTAGELPLALKYPDSEIDPAQIQARLILCRLMQGNLSRSRVEFASFQEAYPEATGVLAGRQGNLSEILKGLLDKAQPLPPARFPALAGTFAGNPTRNQVLPEAFDVGAIAWSIPVRPVRVERNARADDVLQNGFDRIDRGPAVLPANVLSYYPVAWKNIGFYCDDAAVFACDLSPERGGKPVWGNESAIYKLPADAEPPHLPPRNRAGVPRFTLSIDGDRLFARLGALSAPSGRNRSLRTAVSALVCLDLARQGDIEWIIETKDLDPDGSRWVFDGAPVAAGGRVYAALHRNDPQLQLNVACFDAATGKLVWNRKVCGGVEALANDVDEIRHQLLTLSEERLFYCTNLGAIAALDARDGALRWVTTYPRVESETIAAFNKRQQHGPNPCVYHDGMVIAAPTDGDRLLAYDAETGILKWENDLNGRVHQVLGISGTRLIAAGDMLWSLDVETGKAQWRIGRVAPESATCGRGLLAGNLVFWPRREEILLVDVSSGHLRRRIDLVRHYGIAGGGNITIADGMMLFAQSDRILGFSPFGMLKKPGRDDLAMTRE